MLRARFSFLLMLILPLAACRKEPAPQALPEVPPAARAEKAAPAEVADAEKAAPSSAPLLQDFATDKSAAPAPENVNAKAASPAVAAGAGKEIALPKAKDGVLPPGAADKVLPVGGQAILKLLDAGAEPRSDLSYALTKGSTQKLQMNMDMVLSMKMGQKALPQTTIPTMTMILEMATTDKNASGEWKIDSKLTQVKIDAKGGQQEQLAAAMRPQIEGMKGLGMAYWVNAKGRVKDVKIDVPKNLPAGGQQMLEGVNQSFESMVAPLPSEPVGLGARWQVVSRLGSAGADLLQSAVYTLKSRDGGKVVLDVALTQVAASDTIKPPGMPPNVTAQVKSFNSGGSGNSQIDIKSVAPEAGSEALKTAMNIAVKGAGASEESSVETQTKVRISKP